MFAVGRTFPANGGSPQGADVVMLPGRQPSSRATSGTRSGGTTCGPLRQRQPTGANRARWPVAPSSGASPSAHPVGRWMRTYQDVPKTNLPMLGATLCALALAIPCAASAADAPAAAPATGGLNFDDPTAPTVFADGSTLAAPLGQLVGGPVTVHGTVSGTKPGDGIAVQRLDPAAGWTTVATATVAPDGAYDATWTPIRAEKTTLRAIPGTQATTATRAAGAAGASSATLEGRALTLYRRAKVTWYGPGFYGHKTACGQRMSRRLLGVAHKTLPCGTLVDLYNNGRTVTVPVIDRGPFRRGTSYDLTAATARTLGVAATTTIGAVRSAAAAPAPAAPAAASRAR